MRLSGFQPYHPPLSAEGGPVRAAQNPVTFGGAVSNGALTREQHALFNACRNGDYPAMLGYVRTLPVERINPAKIGGGTPLHEAAKNGYGSIVQLYLDRLPPDQANPTDNRGETPLFWAAAKGHADVVKRYLDKLPADKINPPNHWGITPLHKAAENGHVDVVRHYLDKLPADQRHPLDQDGLTPLTQAALKGQTGVVACYEDLLPPETFAFWLQYSKAIHDIRLQDALLPILPELLLKQPLLMNAKLARALERQMDMQSGQAGYPNTAEFMLLLNHPELWERDPKKTAPFTKALTSTTPWGQSVSDKTVVAWKQIGLLTHAFRFWRFDAQGGPDSLLSRFGFAPIEDVRENRFGKGYFYAPQSATAATASKDPFESLMEAEFGKDNPFSVGAQTSKPDLDPDVRIVFRRGFLLVSHPEWGTLLVRNSSPVFGRDLLTQPAYYMPQAMDETRLKHFEPADQDMLLDRNGFRPILRPQIYGVPHADDKVLRLSQALISVKNAFGRWKFDPQGSAYSETHGKAVLSLDPLTQPGFSALRNQYRQWLAQGKDLPDLAMNTQAYPPFAPYARLAMNTERIEELGKIINGDWDVSPEMRAFIETGIRQHAELVMLKSGT